MHVAHETDAQYHGFVGSDGFPAIGSSKLKTFVHESPKHFQEQYLLGTRDGLNSDASRLGRHIHAYALEGKDKFDHEYAVYPASTLNAAGAINPKSADYQGFIADAMKSGLTPIKEKDLDEMRKTVSRVGNFLHNHHEYAHLTARGAPEVAHRIEREDGIVMQAKYDWLNVNGRSDPLRSVVNGEKIEYDISRPYFLDLKATTVEISEWMRKADRDFHYDGQAALYTNIGTRDIGERPLNFYGVVAYEKNPRVDPRFQLVSYPREVLDIAHARNEAAFARMAECKRTNVWPDGTGGILTMDPSRRRESLMHAI